MKFFQTLKKETFTIGMVLKGSKMEELQVAISTISLALSLASEAVEGNEIKGPKK